MIARLGTLLPLALLLLVSACASVEFERTTPTSGTFRSNANAVTFMSIDFPAPALSTARSNAADSGLPNLIVEEQVLYPHLGWFDWLMEIVGFRHVSIRGTWGYPPEEEESDQ